LKITSEEMKTINYLDSNYLVGDDIAAGEDSHLDSYLVAKDIAADEDSHLDSGPLPQPCPTRELVTVNIFKRLM
jgi:hypothetical protein